MPDVILKNQNEFQSLLDAVRKTIPQKYEEYLQQQKKPPRYSEQWAEGVPPSWLKSPVMSKEEFAKNEEESQLNSFRDYYFQNMERLAAKQKLDLEERRKENAWREAESSIPKPETEIYQNEQGTYKNINLPPKTDMTPDEITGLQSAIASRNPQAMNAIQKQIAQRRKEGVQQGQQVRAMKNNPAFMDATVKVRSIFSQFGGQYNPNADPLENLNNLIQANPEQAQEINSRAMEILKKTSGKAEPRIDKDFMSAINNLDGLYKSRASIEKGVDPDTAMYLPPEQLEIAKKTIQSQIANRESIISRTWPDEWKTYQTPSSGAARDTMRQYEKQLNKNIAMDYLRKAGGDRQRAQEMAAKDGYRW